MVFSKKQRAAAWLVPALWLLAGCGPARYRVAVEGKNIRIEFDDLMHSRVVAKFDGRKIPLTTMGPSEYLSLKTGEVKDFTLIQKSSWRIRDRIGRGQRWELAGITDPLRKTVIITIYDDFPQTAFYQVSYEPIRGPGVTVTGWTNNQYTLRAQPGAPEPAFWSYQSGSYERRPDWVLPLKTGFHQRNYLGMNASDYGGGPPIVDIWRRDAGLGVGHVEKVPKLVSLSVARPTAAAASLAVTYRHPQGLAPGETLRTFRTFVTVHQGDYFRTLRRFRQVMVRQGVQFHPAPADAFQPLWCAWGYGRKVRPGQIYGALPIVKKLGFRWVTVDDGWQTAEGDWFLNPKKFPRGDADMKALVDRIHAEGFKAQLWWAPLAADPGTRLLAEHPEEVLLNQDGSKRKISWWNSWYLCPAVPEVVSYHQALVRKFLQDWGFDGLKIDGQFLNQVPRCYNPAHHHARPEDSVEALPRFFQKIYETARSIKPDALVEICPCGTAYSFYYLPYLNMTVASDPLSSWQVRLKGKTLKALAGDQTAYFGDHVELSDGGDDFASTVGVGGVVGTNFVWPPGSAGKRTKLDLTPAKQKIWAKWVRIYKEKMLSRGRYLGALYDIGFDRPEAHAIRKGDTLYYAFYAPHWKGPVELRGLAGRSYHVTDYEKGVDLGTVHGPKARLEVDFTRHLLIEARPE